MKLLIIANDKGRKYAFNVYSTIEYEDGAISANSRKAESDNIDEFLNSLKEMLLSNKAEIKSKFKKGDFVKVVSQGHCGIITEVYHATVPKPGYMQYSVCIHNGIKPTNIGTVDESLVKITKDEFKKYIKDSGHTSMAKFLN